MDLTKYHLPIQETLTASANPGCQAVWLREVLPPIIVPTTEPNTTVPVERTVFPIFINDIRNNSLTDALNNWFKQNNIAGRVTSPTHTTVIDFFFKLYMDIRRDNPEIIGGSFPAVDHLVFEQSDTDETAAYQSDDTIGINLNTAILDLTTNALLHELGHALDIDDDFQTQLTDAPYFRTAAAFWRRSLNLTRLPLTDVEKKECFPFFQSTEGTNYMVDSLGISQQYEAEAHPAEFVAFFWEHLNGPNRTRYEALLNHNMFLKNAVTVWKAIALFEIGNCQDAVDTLRQRIDEFKLKSDTEQNLLHFDKKLKSVLAHHPKDQTETAEVLRLYRKANRSLTRDGQVLFARINDIYQTTKQRPDMIERMNRLRQMAQVLWESYQQNQNDPPPPKPKSSCQSRDRNLYLSHPTKERN